MALRKTQLSKADFRQKVREHGIRFAGPAPPRTWPDEYKHHFQAIRAIEKVEYDTYRDDITVPEKQRKYFRESVRFLRRKASEFLDDVKTNEDTWRLLEVRILERFDKDVICGNCNDEKWKAGAEADCRRAANQVNLKTKRLQRRMCICGSKRVKQKTNNSDDENGALFRVAIGETVTHASGDDLEQFVISMKPDRVVGLRPPYNMTENECHFPVKDKGILLPFLLVEAKRAANAPGFRAIQYQSVFPIRRFLKAQKDLHGPDVQCEPCMVWFFAYQGEQWRLHIATEQNDRVKLYDLWQGTIESQDGALQLLLIVDYIWSWARDVYRPNIRELIRNSRAGFRDFSPASTDRFRQSVSLSSAPTPAPYSQDLEQTNRVVIDLTETATSSFNDDDGGFHRDQGHEDAILEDAAKHNFLRWRVGHRLSPSWTNTGSICHSSFAHFEFKCCVLHIPEAHILDEVMDDGVLPEYESLFSRAVRINLRHISKFQTLWTGNSESSAWTCPHVEGLTHVTFGFQTVCDPMNWQVKKLLFCITWIAPSVQQSTIRSSCEHMMPTSLQLEQLHRTILHARNFQGRDLVSCALRNTSMVLQNKPGGLGFEWRSLTLVPPFKGVIEVVDCFEPITQSTDPANTICHHRLRNISSRICLMRRDTEVPLQTIFPDLEPDTRTGNSMLALRPSSWPITSPRFCLFVLSEIADESVRSLHLLLEEAHSGKDFYGEIGHQWSRSDWDTLRAWRRTLFLEA